MAHNVRQRADSDAAWTTVLLNTELHNWDSYIFQSINGDAGGTWAPATAIVIGGSGIEVTGPATLDDLADAVMNSGANLQVLSGAAITIGAGGSIDMAATAAQSCYGSITIESSGYLYVDGTLQLRNGGVANLASGFAMDVYGGAVVTFKTGGSLVQDAGATATLEGTSTVGGSAAGTVAIGAHGTLSFASGKYPSMLSHYQWVPCRGDTDLQSPDDWVSNGVGRSCSTALQRKLWHRVGIPGHLTLTDVEVHWRGPSHGTWPPENLTTFNVYKADAGTDGTTLLASTADTSAQGTYESAHSLVVATGLSELFATDEFLLIEMVTESGTNAEAYSRWLHADMKVAFTELRGI